MSTRERLFCWPLMTYIRANGTALHLEMMGRGDPVLLLADIGEDLSSWTFQLGTLASCHFVLALDNRGSGRSESPVEPYTIGTMAQDVISLMDIIGLDKAHLIGHGMGGLIAQSMAAKRPGRVKSLITICTPVRPTDEQRSIYQEWLKAGEEGRDPMAISELMTPWVFSPDFLENERWKGNVLKGRARRYGRTCWNGVRDQFEAMLRHDAMEDGRCVSCPSLALYGKYGRLVPPSSARELAEGRGGCAMELDGGHMLPLELLRSLIREEMTFLSGIDG